MSLAEKPAVCVAWLCVLDVGRLSMALQVSGALESGVEKGVWAVG